MNFIERARQRSDMRVLDRSTDEAFDVRIFDDDLGVCKVTIDGDGETKFEPNESCSKIFKKLENNGGVE